MSPRTFTPNAKAELPPLIPRKVLFGNPDRVSPQVSPDGKLLAYIAPDEGVLNVWVRTVGASDDRAVTEDRKRGIRYYTWAENSRQLLYIQDKDGDENWHVYATDIATENTRDLTPINGIQARILATEPQFPNEVLVAINERNPQLHDVYRVDLRTAERNMVAENDQGFIGWLADQNLAVRGAMQATPDGGTRLLVRDTVRAPWRPLVSWDTADALNSGPVAFTADGRSMYIISSAGSNTGELRRVDLATGKQTTLASDPQADVSSLFIHPVTRVVQAVAFTKEREEWKVLDPAIADDFDALRKAHRGDFTIINRDRADRTWLVAYVTDDGPVYYYAWQRPEKKAEFLFTNRKELVDLTLARMEPIAYQARDGLVVHGYLTLPPGLEPKNLPLVLNVHGGPWYRDTWGYNGEVQWLANRGYAVLQVNFRGSTGYGKGFLNAGNREWGGKMQDDLVDAVKWAIERGFADPKRIAIYGGSYGGYATLRGMTSTPELFACGVSIVGPSNLITFMKSIPPYWKPLEPIFFERVGNPEKDAEFLKERSPLTHVDKITNPLLIAQGANDPRVNRAESLQIVEAMKAKSKTVEYVEYPDEGHGLARPENRLDFYTKAEKFLSEHVGGRYEKSPDDGGGPSSHSD
ncbi:MAG: S9 family peptidase [Phycisphaerae bacterium]|nr:S9 family peptidase [Phycisphaerae bacterium]